MELPEFKALSGRAKIPLLEDGPLMIGESAAISVHLAERYRAQQWLLPVAGSDDRARHDELCFFIMTELDGPLYITRRHDGLADIYGEAPAAVESAKAYFLRSAGEMERRFEDERTYLLGDAFSVADILLQSCLFWGKVLGLALPPALEDYSGRMAERPAFAAAMKTNFTPAAMAALNGAGSPTASPSD
jgi:glutathione S-transferase